MKILNKLTILFLFLVVATSCGNGKDKEIEELNKTLMAGHDEVMPKSMNISSLKKNILEKVKDSSDEMKNKALELNTSLQKAEDDMYLWMDNYGKAMNDVEDKEEKLTLYKSLSTDIERVKKDTDFAISNAKAFLADSTAK